MPRPNIDEELATQIKQIHRETQADSAGSLQEALDTVVQLALQSPQVDSNANQGSSGWYPGKYAGKILDSVVEGGQESDPSGTRSQIVGQGRSSSRRTSNPDPHTQAVFKTYLDEDMKISVPAAEVDAFGYDSGELLQVVVSSVETNDE